MLALDWIFLAVLVCSMVMGAWRGLVYEVFSLVSWALAFVLAQWLAPAAAAWLPMQSASEVVRYAAGFVLVFIATLLLGSLVTVVVKKLVAAVGLRPIDRVLGALFGVLRGVVILLVATVLVGMTPMRTAAWWQEGVGVHMATTTLQVLQPVLPQEFGKYLPSMARDQ